MDYQQRMFYGMPDRNTSKMPFYMAYPMQSLYMEELEYERDMQKLKDMYPKEVRSIQAMVEDECDKMEYEGSLMFDEYPDRVLLFKTANDIYDNAMVLTQTDRSGKGRDRDLLDVIQVLLYDEMYRRRGRRRRCCRKWW